MGARLWLSLAAGLLPAGCAFFLDTGELSGGPVAGDGGRESGPVSPVDGGADVDAAPLPRFCARALHGFCADFEGPTVDDGFSDKEEQVGGALSLVSWPGQDDAHSLFATMPRRATEKGYAALSRRFDGAWRRQRVEADLYVEPPAFEAGDSNFGIMCMGYYAGANEDGQCLSIAADALFFGGNSPPFPTGRWVHIRLEFDPAARHVVGKLDNIDLEATFTTPSGSGAPSSLFQIGVLGYNVPSPEARLHVDNVTVDDF